MKQTRNIYSNSAQKAQDQVSELAKQSFDAFAPFVNSIDCGIETNGGPVHLITKEARRLAGRWERGKKLFFQTGKLFNYFLHYSSQHYTPKRVQDHIQQSQKLYYTSGRNGFALAYLDIDAHKDWQVDDFQAADFLRRYFPFGFFRPSSRGQNGFIKVDFRSASGYKYRNGYDPVRESDINDHNNFCIRLQNIVRKLFLRHQILCDFEVKGTITTDKKSGSLAKFPFNNTYPAHKRSSDDCWNFDQLRKFEQIPVVPLRELVQWLDRIEASLNYDAIESGRAHKDRSRLEWLIQHFKTEPVLRLAQYREGRLGFKALKKDLERLCQEASDLESELLNCPHADLVIEGRKAINNLKSLMATVLPPQSSEVVPNPCSHPSHPGTISASGIDSTLCTVDPPGSPQAASRALSAPDSTNAFERQGKALRPWQRKFFFTNGRHPNLDEAMAFIRDNRHFSGSWEENLAGRRKRVHQIITWNESTFDPKISQKRQTIEITSRVKQVRRMLVNRFGRPKHQRHTITYADIETFLAIELFITQNMNADGTQPGKRVEALWNWLLGQGGTSRRFEYTRYKVIRDWLTDCGYINWTDESYCPGERACKWHGSDELIALLLRKNKKRDTNIFLIRVPQYPNRLIRPINVRDFDEVRQLERDVGELLGLAA